MRWISDTVVGRLRQIAESPDLENTKYLVLREVGRGGMSVVYLAEDTELNRQVAIKVLSTPLLEAGMIDRILREARIISRLEHPGIVPVHDTGTLPDGRVFYVMKYVRGDRLDRYIDSLDSIFDRLHIFLRACEAVAFAHASHVIHRDLKPENIMVGQFGEVLVMDWGTAKLLHADMSGNKKFDVELTDGPEKFLAEPLATVCEEGSEESSRGRIDRSGTAEGLLLGTPAYMAPEQACQGSDLDERCDVYGLGGILYFLLTKRPPYDGADLSEVRKQQRSSPIRPRRLNSKVTKPLEAICLRALSPSRDERYHSVNAMITDVSRFLEGKSVAAYRENVFERADRWIRRNRFLVIMVLAYLLMRILLIIALGR